MFLPLHVDYLYRKHPSLLRRLHLAMKVLPYIFIVLTVSGFWCPIDWSSGWRRNLYWIYSTLVIISSILFASSQIIYVVHYAKNVDEFAGSFFILLTTGIVLYKIEHLMINRRNIIKFTETLRNDMCRPNGTEEIKIQKEYDRRIRQKSLYYGVWVEFSIWWMFIGFFVTHVPERKLPINAWIPCDYSNGIGYWIPFLHQLCGLRVNSILNTTYDALFCGLMGQSCAQLGILRFRLESIPETIINIARDEETLNDEKSIQRIENRALIRCIQHHLDIFNLTKSMNDAFRLVIFVQCAVSTIVLCSSIYMLSNMKPFGTEFTTMVGYIICMLIQIFLYCWFGNEVIVESMNVSDSIYSMDWTKLKVRTQKNLLMLMTRTLEPIKFTSGSVLVLSLDTYMSLLKLSYSVYNLMQRKSEQ